MRFMIIRKADAQTEAGVMPKTELLEAMGNYMAEMEKAGILRGGDGLHPSSKGAKVKFHKGRPTVIDGPFAEAKEIIAGYAIIDVASRAEAIEWVKKWPALDGDGELELEIRPFFEADEFGEEFTPEQREREAAMRERIEKKR
ncbi:MAG: YciI family protein [Gemmatimonadaceae bacterium]|nr:YciI family protein [Gemmatimonadaceae bacterium]NUQ91722.1 YciI family protein [Gemmatimonadaceae bacterium]NUR19349.1 YciI family protein [Gemmatimonadaceae bacterium]NUS95923.1 YciI family protein [Gemmatimonadaceae bacterium]